MAELQSPIKLGSIIPWSLPIRNDAYLHQPHQAQPLHLSSSSSDLTPLGESPACHEAKILVQQSISPKPRWSKFMDTIFCSVVPHFWRIRSWKKLLSRKLIGPLTPKPTAPFTHSPPSFSPKTHNFTNLPSNPQHDNPKPQQHPSPLHPPKTHTCLSQHRAGTTLHDI